MKAPSNWLLSIAVAVSSLGPTSPAQAGQERESQKTVLTLIGTGRDAEGANAIDRTLRLGLSKALKGAVDYYSEYFDTGRFPDGHSDAALAEFLRQKYRGLHFDLLVTIDIGGFEFLARHRDELFPSSPLVFWSLSPPSVTLPNSTGLIADVDFGASLELVARLQPDVRQVFVVSGAAPSDEFNAKGARDQFRRFEPRFTFTYLSGLTTNELERRVAALPPASIVYYVIVYKDGAGDTFIPLEYLDRIAAVANRPIYSWIDSTIDHGVLGGRMVPLGSHAGALANLALRVLNGERAESIPVSKAANLDVVDWRQLRRWGISESRVPAGIDGRHWEPGAWERYKAYIVGALAFMLVQAALIAGLLIQRRARQRAELKVTAIIEGSDDAIVVKDLSSTVQSWNRGAERLFGHTAQEMIGRSIRTIIPEDRWSEEEGVLRAIRRGENVNHFETVRRRKDGSEVHVSLAISPIYSNAGVIVGASKIARDISDRKRAEVESRHNLALAADANRRMTMTALTGSIAHELGQPLNAILHNTQAAEMLVSSNRATPETLREILGDIRAADLRATQIIQRHRSMLRSHQFETKPIDILAVVRESIALVAHDTKSKGIEVDAELPPDPCFVVGDPVLLQQVVVNLVMNAMDAMAETPPERRRITFRNEVTSGNVEVSIRDAGTGVPVSVDGKLFEPFVTTKTNGVGIGLTIARTIIEAHGGRIAARNNRDGGATFTVELPCAEISVVS